MSGTVAVRSASHLESLKESSLVVVAYFYSEDSDACKALSPTYQQYSVQFSQPKLITFAIVDVATQGEVSKKYEVKNDQLPTVIIFKDGEAAETVKSANRLKLAQTLQKLARELSGDEGGSEEKKESSWVALKLPKGYSDVSEQVDVSSIDMLNADNDFGSAKDLFSPKEPWTLGSGGSSGGGDDIRDWVETDTDEQLMLYIPLHSTLKVHTLHVTSLPSSDDEEIRRPKTIHIYSNTTQNLGFDEAENVSPTQTVTLEDKDWDEKTGTAKIELRFVKFQSVTSIVLFIVDNDGETDRTRLDRIRIVGEQGEKRKMGKLEKIGNEAGE